MTDIAMLLVLMVSLAALLGLVALCDAVRG